MNRIFKAQVGYKVTISKSWTRNRDMAVGWNVRGYFMVSKSKALNWSASWRQDYRHAGYGLIHLVRSSFFNGNEHVSGYMPHPENSGG